jgi:1-acyl-sn-glycerol-3-phosphate acyltransferase
VYILEVLRSALIVYDTLATSAATMLDAVRGRLDRRSVDHRLRSWADDVLRHADLRLTVEGAHDVDWSRAYVIMSNHQSLLDIPAVASAVSGSLRFIAKKELFRIPVFGPAMRAAGIISIDRGDRGRAIASLRSAATALREGVHIWIAPEGTRSPTGSLGKLKKGGFVLAIDTGAPILPVAITGTRDALPAGKGLAVRGGAHARVRFGRPIEVTGRSREELMRAVEIFLTENV